MDKGKAAKCRGCGADILWATLVTGTKVPLDTTTEKRFVMRFSKQRSLGDLRSLETLLVDTYQSHFVTCPVASRFRKPKAQRPRSDEPVDG